MAKKRNRQPEQASENGRPIAQRLELARDFFERFHWRRWLMMAGLSLLLALALSPNLLSRVPRVVEGETYPGIIRAPFSITVVDEEAIKKERLAKADAVVPIFQYDAQVGERAVKRLDSAFGRLNSLFAELDEIELRYKLLEESVENSEPAAAEQPEDGAAPALSPAELARLKKERLANLRREKQEKIKETEAKIQQALKEQRADFVTQLETSSLTDQEYALLIEQRFSPKLVEHVAVLLRPAYEGVYIPNEFDQVRQQLQAEGQGKPAGLQVYQRGSETGFRIEMMDAVFSIPRRQELLLEQAPVLLPTERVTPPLRELLAKIALAQIKPNLFFDEDRTQQARMDAAERVIPITYSYRKGQVVIEEYQRVTREQAMIMDRIRETSQTKGWAVVVTGLGLLVFFMLLLSLWLTDLNIASIVIADRDAAAMSILLVVWIIGLRLIGWLDEQLMDLFAQKPPNLLLFLFPLAAPAMLIRFLTRFEIALIFSVVLAVLSGLAIAAEPENVAVFFLVMLIGAHTMRGVMRRGQILRGGVAVGGAMLPLTWMLALIKQEFSIDWLITLPALGLAGGILSAVIVLGAAPFFEYVFGYMTNISLLELANYEQPLLKRLARLTPGTFHHSIAIGSLAEAATEAIGADSLLTRVGAMYHDIGKSMNPQYFVENQRGENPHDQLNDPEQSARLVIGHVLDGVKMAREHRLPQQIIDFIQQHHGTRTVIYFLDQARKQAQRLNRDVDPELFRYPGPRPQTKETGIMMICDVVEARSRTMDDRSPEAVQGMIRDMIEKIRRDGQLEECPLTEAELMKIVTSLAEVILGMRHDRIAYPDQVAKRTRRDRLFRRR